MQRVTFSAKVLPATKDAIDRLASSYPVGEFVDQMVEREVGREQTLAEGAEMQRLAFIGRLLAQPSEANIRAAGDVVFSRMSALRKIRRRVTLEAADVRYVEAGSVGPKTWEQAEADSDFGGDGP